MDKLVVNDKWMKIKRRIVRFENNEIIIGNRKVVSNLLENNPVFFINGNIIVHNNNAVLEGNRRKWRSDSVIFEDNVRHHYFKT